MRTPGAGPKTQRRLLDAFGSVEAIMRAPPRAVAEAGGRQVAGRVPAADDHLIQQDLAWLAQPGNGLITWDQAEYPQLLRDLSDAPLALFYTGDSCLLHLPMLAIVGSRTPTRGGAQTAEEFSASMASCGLGIVSGLANGIDAAAHRGALKANGATIAVVGTGLDRVYPANNQQLAQEIAVKGLLLSEHPPGTEAHPSHFPRRNRIIAGLTIGTLVVEAAQKSGSLITARLSAEAGREVFAIPGSIHNPLARGTHQLIREGAKLVESAQDILEELAPLLGQLLQQSDAHITDAPTESASAALDPDYVHLLEIIGYDPIAIDSLIQQSGLAADVVSSMLLLLELNGHVESLPGNHYCRTGARSS
jgi:DNA processing protein